MPFTLPELTRIEKGDRERSCTCTRARDAHPATYLATSRLVDERTGELGSAEEVPLCTNAAAAMAHMRGIVHPVFNPAGAITEPAKKEI